MTKLLLLVIEPALLDGYPVNVPKTLPSPPLIVVIPLRLIAPAITPLLVSVAMDPVELKASILPKILPEFANV